MEMGSGKSVSYQWNLEATKEEGSRAATSMLLNILQIADYSTTYKGIYCRINLKKQL